ncbi:rhodanese-like domain-containing protein [Marinoscillum sp. MHG1-6]|uniref:rhodanese-like domain-containing protein n=1 Tax=Marinoscillum sp. MHG1-6 TaxID=2959627 RepID=UPI002157E5C7|nr:rhodanese-like domain-containing protein [Marinoscillum sp. MHG1-6]
MGILSNLFGGGSANLQEYLENGAVIIDVRTPGEYQGGHVDGSKNFPLQTLGASLSKIKNMNKPIVLCCASGMRSGQATSMLKSEGIDCINGGSWLKVNGLVS